ncbi:MAG: sigma-70 family RNA polymerase sigma factor [Armatimonadetes bacterium]|nr:MAG: sigma-70 family RNA polymerase sigma factor [Armatimonadota bacterium]
MNLEEILKLAENGVLPVERLNEALGDVDPSEIESILNELEARGIRVADRTPDKKKRRSKLPPLPPEATVSLEELRRLEEGDVPTAGEAWFDFVGHFDPLDAETERAVAVRARSGDADALRLLVLSNLRLVMEISHRFAGRGIPRYDLVQEGNAALVRAAQKYDPSHGYRFAAYARWWVRAAMAKAIAVHTRSIRLPRRLASLLKRIQEARLLLAQQLGRDPTDDELAKEVQLSVDQLGQLRALDLSPLSLEAPVRGEETSSLGDFVEDFAEAEEQVLDTMLTKQVVQDLFRGLPDLAQKVLDLRYGLSAGEPLSVEATAKRLNLTPEKVAAIEERALAAMRKPLEGAEPEMRN